MSLEEDVPDGIWQTCEDGFYDTSLDSGFHGDACSHLLVTELVVGQRTWVGSLFAFQCVRQFLYLVVDGHLVKG